MVYLPMCYMYCHRFTPDVKSNPLLLSLRKELYCENYDTIHWDSFRQTCADIDEYSKLNPVMKVAQDFLSFYEYFLRSPVLAPFRALRTSYLNYVIEYIYAEDIQTNFIDIGPVNKSLNMLCVFVHEMKKANNSLEAARSSEPFQRHLSRVEDYLWVAEDGMKMQGYNGSQCWDTSFCAQAIVEGDFAQEFPDCAKNVYRYLDRCQIRENEDNKDRYFRHESKGGWPFSTAAHGWPISDCTSEGLKAVLAFHSPHLQWKFGTDSLPRITDERLFDAVNVILTLHNHDGGWATYENNRGYRWYEMMNPSEVFGDIMIDYSYVECTSACITALKKFSASYPTHRATDVLNAIQSGRRFLKAIQRSDGSWYGSWGVCFIYGTWFGIGKVSMSCWCQFNKYLL
jgi:squalene/oxidosqualene cyclase-like protein